MQVSSLLYAMGAEAEKIFAQFGLSEDDQKDYDVVLTKLNEYFVPKKNVIHERATFHRRDQRAGENVEQYVRSLYELAEHADFPEKEETIRDRLVLGLNDQELSEKLQLETDLTLRKAITLARQHEQVKQEMTEQRRGQHVDSVRHKKSGQQFKPRHSFGHANSHSQAYRQHCGKCGRSHELGNCPAKGKKCHNCGKLSHFKQVCKTSKKKIKGVHEVETTGEEERGETFLIGAVKSASDSVWRVELEVEGVPVLFKIDTGADVNVIGKTLWEKLGKPKLSKCDHVTLMSPGGKMKQMGRFQTAIKSQQTTIYVIDSDVECLLSRNTSTSLNLVKRVDETSFSTLKCKPVKIKLKEGAQPYSVSVARRVPIPLQEKVKRELQSMKDKDIIEEVTEPTDWCCSMVPVVKPSGAVRICVDLKKLNNSVQRERFIIPTTEEIIHKLRGSSVFSKLDAKSGFWQIPLDQDSAKLTTFITPFGRFYMKRLPFGISSAPEIFQRIMTEILDGLDGVICYFDDILLHTQSMPEHDKLLQVVGERVKDAGLELNEEKCEYKKEEITFLGHVISREGVKPDPTKIEAIKKLEEPADVGELRRFLGMINYLGRYVPHLSTTLKPLNDLLKNETEWSWGHQQREAFQKVKEMLSSAPTLAFYDPNKPTTVSADASSYGLGCVLLQQHEDGLRPVAYASRTLTEAEKRYAQIEKECLASVWACEKFEQYLMGMETFTLETDHKPLVPVINNKDLSDTPLRCQRLLIRLMRFKPQCIHRPGRDMVVADTLSRSPLTTEKVSSLDEEVAYHINMVRTTWPVTDPYMSRIRSETQRDVNLRYTMEYTKTGWPHHKKDVALAARDFFAVRGELSMHDGILLRGDRIVIPFPLRGEILERIHHGHLGIVKCRERAKQGVWWPRISKDIQHKVSGCRTCLQKQPSQAKEPLITTKLPDRPFQHVAVDICEVSGQHHLVFVDYYSRWIDIYTLTRLTTAAVIAKLKSCFARHGIPETLMSDNGPQFSSSEFRNFVEEWNFSHISSSPHYPQSNGEAERAVRTAKGILKQKKPELALLTYRATPLPALGVSPAELALGRRLRTTLPVPPETLMPSAVHPNIVQERDENYKRTTRGYYNKGARHLPELSPGDPVLIKEDGQKDWKRPGEVIGECAPRSYLVKTADGELRRNRRHLRYNTAAGSPVQQQLATDMAVPPSSGQQQLQQQPPTQTAQPPPVTLTEEQSPVLDTTASDPSPATPLPPGRPPDQGSTVTTRSGRAVVKPARFR